jgi:hypothetical protein
LEDTFQDSEDQAYVIRSASKRWEPSLREGHFLAFNVFFAGRSQSEWSGSVPSGRSVGRTPMCAVSLKLEMAKSVSFNYIVCRRSRAKDVLITIKIKN